MRRVARLRREVAERVVAPEVLQPVLHQTMVVQVAVHRQQLDRRHAEAPEIVDHRRACHAAVGAAQSGRHLGMRHGEAAHMQLVDHHVLPGQRRTAVVTPGEGRLQHATFGHQGGAVAAVERQVGAAIADAVAVERIPPSQLPDKVLGVRIDEQLVRVEAVAGLRLVRSMHAITIGLARPRLRQIAMPDMLGAFGQGDTLQLVATAVVEQAQLDAFGVLRKSAKFTPCPSQVAPSGQARPGQTAVIG